MSAQRIKEEHCFDPTADPGHLELLRLEAEKIKILLSTQTSATLAMHFDQVVATPGLPTVTTPVDVELEVLQHKFEMLTLHLLITCRQHIWDVLASAGVSSEQVCLLTPDRSYRLMPAHVSLMSHSCLTHVSTCRWTESCQ